MKRRIALYYRPEPEQDRWVTGDRFVRPLLRRVLRGKPRMGGVDKVARNLRAGLVRIGQDHVLNPPYRNIRPSDWVAVLGRGRHCMDGYDRPNPIVAGIALMSHPAQWPTLMRDLPVVCYLQHSEWACDVYRPWYGDACEIWPVGIDTDAWKPAGLKTTDYLVYEKFLFNAEIHRRELLEAVLRRLRQAGRSWEILRYGNYDEDAYRAALSRCRAAIFLSAHESQGIAYQEAMSSGLPVLAWNPGFSEDPEQIALQGGPIPTSSVPWFDESCGVTFRGIGDFPAAEDAFHARLSQGLFQPRAFILKHLTLAESARRFVTILEERVP